MTSLHTAIAGTVTGIAAAAACFGWMYRLKRAQDRAISRILARRDEHTDEDASGQP